ncbi:hypothetical protein ABBQ32_013801 [Trebouxia sp. C0010 RCD-2024]
MKAAVIRTCVNQVCLCDADKTGQYVRQLLEPAFTTVPAAVDTPALFQSALHITGTVPFPVPDVFYESQRLQNKDMEFYLAPVSKSGATTFSSAIHTILCKQFPAGTEMAQAGQFDQLVCEIMELLDQYSGKLGLKRKRNQGEASFTMMAKRPDLCVLIRNALLFKGDDKYEEGKLDQAVAELKQNMRRWSRSYHGQVEFLLCYAMGGGHVRICMLRRDDPDSCLVLSGDHNIYAMRGRLQLLRIAVLLYRILAIQQTQLPRDAVPLGSELEFPSGTTITVMEDYIIKRVDLEKQPHLVDQLQALQQLYKATRASKHLIRSEEGPHIRTRYTVILSPFGDQLGSGSPAVEITSLVQLQAAIRCILLALKDLHAAAFAHTDIRWPNVIKCSNTVFCLIDLETAVKLGCKWNIRKHGPHRNAWTGNTLTRGRYTAESDLALVGQLLTEPELPPLGELGSVFAEDLMAKSLSLQDALHHVWLQS